MPTLQIILGPTAVGKTAYAIEAALRAGSPVVSCDSRQVFRELRIGVARPDEAELAAVPHYFIADRSVTEPFTAGDYEVEALALLERLFQDHETVVMAGGSIGTYSSVFIASPIVALWHRKVVGIKESDTDFDDAKLAEV